MQQCSVPTGHWGHTGLKETVNARANVRNSHKLENAAWVNMEVLASVSTLESCMEMAMISNGSSSTVLLAR